MIRIVGEGSEARSGGTGFLYLRFGTRAGGGGAVQCGFNAIVKGLKQRRSGPETTAFGNGKRAESSNVHVGSAKLYQVDTWLVPEKELKKKEN